MRKALLTGLASLAAVAAVLLPVPARAAGAPPPPSGVWVSQGGPTSVRWSWNAVPGATSYKVTYSYFSQLSSPRFRTVTGRSATIGNLTPGHIYYVAVRAVTAGGTSARSVIVPGKVGAVPKPNGVAVRDRDLVDWRWNSYVGAAKYLVQQSTTPTFTVNVESHVVSGRTIRLGVGRDSYGYLRVKPLNSAGDRISTHWSMIGSAFVPNHPF
jgi:hypothetical protein